jgi:hypothetical protein
MASTGVAGTAISELCVTYASGLSLRIYDEARSHLPASLAVIHDSNMQHWDEVWRVDDPDGFTCALYEPKQRGSGSTGTCPPVLVFRGSDSEPEDVAEMGMTVRADMNFVLAVPLAAQIALGLPATIQYAHTVDTTFSPNAAYKEKTLAEMRTMGLTEETLFVNQPGATALPVGGWASTRAAISATWTTTASMFYAPHGDWPVNFAQGLGQVPPQYRKAIAKGLEAADFANANYDGRLIITGHSLGGGLASAAAVAARIAHPNLVLRGQTFNSAGLHENTAQAAGGTRGTAASVPVRAVHVQGEILNSMQTGGVTVPLMSRLLHWGGKSMPPAVANPTPRPGVSPGPMPIFGLVYRPEMDILPDLYPIESQNAPTNPNSLTPPLTELGPLLGLAEQAPRVNDFISTALHHIVGRLSEDNILTYGEAISIGTGLNGVDFGPVGAQIAAAITGTGPMPDAIDIGNSDYRNTIVEPFFNGIIRDAVYLARIMMASGEYHTFWPCGYTFLVPRNGTFPPL